MQDQDHTLAINDRPDRRLTDEELAADWCQEFPNSRAVKNGRITAEMVRTVRHLFNNGTGDHGTPGRPRDGAKADDGCSTGTVSASRPMTTCTRKVEAKTEKQGQDQGKD